MKLRQQKAGRRLMKRRVHKRATAKHDWRAFDALTEADILKAARSDPDAQLCGVVSGVITQWACSAARLRWAAGHLP